MRRRYIRWIALVLCMLCMPAEAWAAQTVYYNTEGGRYYHAQPRCDAIDEAYWDEMAETTTAYTQRLGLRGPCPRCFEEESDIPAVMLPVKNEGGRAKITALRFGGGMPDEVSCLARTPQGHIVMAGYTASSDGTLSDRTKSGWSGWIAMVDAQGNTLWNFCSRHASRDRMRAPVVHEDGTITVLLESRGNEYDQMELIRLDMQGNVLSRKPLLRLEKGQGALAPEMPGAFAGGYVIASYDERREIAYEPVKYSRAPIYQPQYHWFDFEGNLLEKTQALWHASVSAISDRHVIEAIDQTYWLCAIDEKGNRTKLSALYEGLRAEMEYRGVVSLKDGGAVGALYEHREYDMKTTLRRWDAQGNLISEIELNDFCANHMQACADRLVVCGETSKSREMMLVFDRDGQMICREEIASSYLQGRSLIGLDENTVACVRSVGGRQTESSHYNWDVQLNIIDIGGKER